MTRTAVAAPSEPEPEWDGLSTCHDCGSGVVNGHHVDEGGDWHTPHVIEETRYPDRSPREEWVSAWQTSREAHR